MNKLNALKHIIPILPIIFLSGCVGGSGGGIDLIGLTKNPIVMIIIGGVVLFFAFKMKK